MGFYILTPQRYADLDFIMDPSQFYVWGHTTHDEAELYRRALALTTATRRDYLPKGVKAPRSAEEELRHPALIPEDCAYSYFMLDVGPLYYSPAMSGDGTPMWYKTYKSHHVSLLYFHPLPDLECNPPTPKYTRHM